MADLSAAHGKSPVGNVVRALALDIASDDHEPTDVPNGFHCSTAGQLDCRFQGDIADVALVLLAGVYYPYRIAIVRDTSTADGAFLYTV